MAASLPSLFWTSTGARRPARAPRTSVVAVTTLDFATIDTLDALAALESEWTALFDAHGRATQVFQTFAWLSIWARLYIEGGTRLSIVTGRHDGRLVLVWPLVVRHRFGFRILSFMGEPLSQYGDVLASADLGDDERRAALDYVLALPADVMVLRRVRDDSPFAPLLRRSAGAALNPQRSPYVDFTGASDAHAFEARFPGKLRSSRRRRRRRLEEQGALTLSHHAPSAEAAALVGTALALKRDWASRAGVVAPALRDARFERFFVEAANAGECAPPLRVSALHRGDVILGVEIAVSCGDRLFGHLLASRWDARASGVGGILAEMMIVSALEQGFAGVDLLAPADPYKREWTTQSIGVGDYAIGVSLAGRAFRRLWLGFGRERVKEAVKALRPVLKSLRRA